MVSHLQFPLLSGLMQTEPEGPAESHRRLLEAPSLHRIVAVFPRFQRRHTQPYAFSLSFLHLETPIDLFATVLPLLFLLAGFLACLYAGILFFRSPEKLHGFVTWGTFPAVLGSCLYSLLLAGTVPFTAISIAGRRFDRIPRRLRHFFHDFHDAGAALLPPRLLSSRFLEFRQPQCGATSSTTFPRSSPWISTARSTRTPAGNGCCRRRTRSSPRR